ncbi:DUF2235 domain-containing protein [Bosea sp. (in: a-proteobacteria)]|jgi:uncharacterized protein (DUF2235 family)/DNA-binding cell septation regulator SpoVG|uniref:DUF2235 domain-containing protein n=1 Tax=Bosea sp. (in: a-proteobacteria) TaxID=1871050 RepID=UPI003F702A9B
MADHDPRKIILLSDGTGNSAAALFKTNVFRLYQALDLSRKDQVAFYDDGVGTSTFKPLAMLGGAFGFGLKRNVLDLYVQLSRTYRPGDRIYMFGFSRGAFTIRILAGLILKQGLVAKGGEAKMQRSAQAAFRRYRQDFVSKSRVFHAILTGFRALRDAALAALDKLLNRKREFGAHRDTIEVRFMGLWDTVAAYGLPIDELTRAWDAIFPLSVPDRDLHPRVLKACHALALDDERNTFHPVLWNEALEPARDRIADERISQVWFAGMHSNVGGSYPLDGLAYVTLDWMMQQVSESGPLGTEGLRFNANEPDRIRLLADPDAPMADSRQGFGGTYRYRPRKLVELSLDTLDPRNPVLIHRIKLHESVMKRIASGVTGYAPIVLPDHYAVAGNDGAILAMPDGKRPARPALPIEHRLQGESRANAQESVWNLVWAKRVAYFSSIFVALLLVALPLLTPAEDVCAGPACFVTPAIDALGSFLPGFAETWLATYRSHPGTFLILAAILLLLVKLGDMLKTEIDDRMRPLLAPLAAAGGKPPATVAPLPDSNLFRLRSSRLYQRVFGVLKRVVMPTLAGVIALLLIVAGLNRVLVSAASSSGLICRKAPTSYTPATPFRTNDPCWSNGAILEKGKRYTITLTIPPGDDKAWSDDGTPTGTLGSPSDSQSISDRAFVLLRRQIGRFWNQPIARIGGLGDDEYPLYPEDWSLPTGTETRLKAQITPKREGPLYLYVNDVVLPFGRWQPGYANNRGEATVEIEPPPKGVVTTP